MQRTLMALCLSMLSTAALSQPMDFTARAAADRGAATAMVEHARAAFARQPDRSATMAGTRTFDREIAFASLASAGVFYANPGSPANNICSQGQPCSLQNATDLCYQAGGTCNIQLLPGLYLNPAVNLYYHHLVQIQGDCNAPRTVELRGTTAGNLIMIQDDVIGIVGCFVLNATVGGVNGIVGRQHPIVDYFTIVFGSMSSHVSMTEFSIASCGGNVWIEGNAVVHAGVSRFSVINMGCVHNITPAGLQISFFANLDDYAVINAQSGSFVGNNTRGVACNKGTAIVHPSPAGPFPGDQPGNC